MVYCTISEYLVYCSGVVVIYIPSVGVSISWASAVLWFPVVIVCISCFEVVGIVEQGWFGAVVPLGILMIIN